MTVVLDADTTTGDLLFHLATDIAILSERIAALECYAGRPSDALRDEIRNSLDARDIHPERAGANER